MLHAEYYFIRTYILLATTLGWNEVVATTINIAPACSQHFNIFQACDHCCTHAAAVCQILHTMLSAPPPMMLLASV